MQPYSVDVRDFKPGMQVKKMSKHMAPEAYQGVVLAVYPKLNALDVEWPLGVDREAAEDLMIVNASEIWTEPHTSSIERIASTYKKALYWNEKGRKYRKSKGEIEDGQMKCPKCKALGMRKARYKHQSDLYSCSGCGFLVKEEDIYDGDILNKGRL